ncbi:pectate lyase family protein [Paenibacillus sp. Aloe-11]|uniref:pectate lyase family protein n=1 Tax=Paenibacillus sp. Aloe-11 TaxID=1050222 RepID=UPI00024EF771|nr:RICIN domain-containing protein [Paenibacillus sp. Aloe-11]EHS57069.1 pectate lyase, polysaccharide lyase family 1 [Paenibacillus sp. Aloe-11]
MLKKSKGIKRGALLLSIIVFINLISFLSFTEASNAADSYPYQAMRIENVNKGWNLNILGYQNNSEVNVWPTRGESNERWKFSTADGVYFKLTNERTGLLLSPLNWSVTEGNPCVLYQDSNRDEQLWRIIGVDKDVNGDDLTYRIVNKANSNMALMLNLGTGKTMLGTYKGNSTHKWKLVSDGLIGFAGHAKDLNGKDKTGTIGGLLGKTVFVNTLAELKEALLDKNPLTIVISSNIDNANSETYDLRIASNKTIIGSYAANRLTDPRLRTDDYFKKEDVSNNIIIKNINVEVKNRRDVVAIAIYGSRNVWIDHSTFRSSLGLDKDEVGKFVWVNTSTYTNTDPDYVTLSYNKFSNRYWTVAFGTTSSLIKNNATVMLNYFDSCVRRTPQSGNGRLHVLNNLIQRTLSSRDDAGYASIIGGEGAHVYSDSNRFDNFKKASSGYWDTEITIDPKAFVKDVGSYTNKGEVSPVDKPYTLPAPNGAATSFDPGSKYSYPIIKAYDADGNDVKRFNMDYTGAVNHASALKYIHFPEFQKYLK